MICAPSCKPPGTGTNSYNKLEQLIGPQADFCYNALTMSVEIPKKQIGDFVLPALGLGTWRMGGDDLRDPENDDERDKRAISAAIELGITHIDTAESYAGGHAEELIGEVLRRHDRAQLFLTSKVSWQHSGYDGAIAAVRASLTRLGVSQLDLYLLHGPSPDVPLRETMRAMEYLLENELTRFVGVSNFHPPLLREAQENFHYKIVSNQIHYNLESRGHEKVGTLEYCLQNQILVTAYRPLGRGQFTEASQAILKKLSAKCGKNPYAIALNWVINKPNVVSLVKSSKPEHLRDDLTALGWRLSSEDEKFLDEQLPRATTMGVGTPARVRRPPDN